MKKKNGTYTYTQVGNTPRIRERVAILYGVNKDGTCHLIAHNQLHKLPDIAGKVWDKIDCIGGNTDSVKVLVLPTSISLMQLYMLIHLTGYLTGYIRETPDMD
jgi:hypothetical protein